METILSLIAHLHTWPVITNIEMMAMKAAFVAPWSNSPDQYFSAYTRDLTSWKNNATKYNVKIIDEDKVTRLVAFISKDNILKDSVMDKWD